LANHILVIEDSPLVQRLVAVCLRELGRPIVSALDGPSGITEACGNPPGVVILDIGLPGIDGWEVLRRMRADPRSSAVPVLVLTAHAQEEYRLEADRQGAEAFMTKPFEPDVLRDTVARLLQGVEDSLQAVPSPGSSGA
jgi:CheY-like chemotaxis protein